MFKKYKDKLRDEVIQELASEFQGSMEEGWVPNELTEEQIDILLMTRDYINKILEGVA